MKSDVDGKEVTLSIVMPVFNEEKTVCAVINRLLAEIPFKLEVTVVDDGSTDATPGLVDACAAKDSRVRVIHKANGGKTSALKVGFQQTRGKVVIIQDADLEYDPGEIIHVIQPILDGQADVVYGSRFLARRSTHFLCFYHDLANRLLTFLSNMLTNLKMTDVETGYKAFRGDIIRNMNIESSGFGIEIEVTAKLARLGVVIREIPISYRGRTYQEGKKIGWTDGAHALWYLLRFNLFHNFNRSFRPIQEQRTLNSISS